MTMRPILATAALAATIATALVLTTPAFARGGGGGPGEGPSGAPSATWSAPSGPASLPPSNPSSARRGGSQMNSAGAPQGFGSPGRRTSAQGASTPPGWSHGQKKGWNGGDKPPGLSKH